tara:strand:- start:14294 stop:14716 length:423 start_codon:yes stop_codon:yes gene_type:complete
MTNKIPPKSVILTTFLNQFSEFITDIVRIFPDDKDLVSTKVYFEGIRKYNPRLILTSWKILVADKYEKEVEKGDFTFFINKDYSKDTDEFADKRNWGNYDYSYINEKINEIREQVSNQSENNKQQSMKYIINLTRLSKLY